MNGKNKKSLAKVAAEITRLRNENATIKANAEDLCWQVWNMWNTEGIDNFDSWWFGKQHELLNTHQPQPKPNK